MLMMTECLPVAHLWLNTSVVPRLTPVLFGNTGLGASAKSRALAPRPVIG